jgi:hypothetical protein
MCCRFAHLTMVLTRGNTRPMARTQKTWIMLRVTPEHKERIKRQMKRLKYPSVTAYMLAAAEVHYREGRGMPDAAMPRNQPLTDSD